MLKDFRKIIFYYNLMDLYYKKYVFTLKKKKSTLRICDRGKDR